MLKSLVTLCPIEDYNRFAFLAHTLMSNGYSGIFSALPPRLTNFLEPGSRYNGAIVLGNNGWLTEWLEDTEHAQIPVLYLSFDYPLISYRLRVINASRGWTQDKISQVVISELKEMLPVTGKIIRT